MRTIAVVLSLALVLTGCVPVTIIGPDGEIPIGTSSSREVRYIRVPGSRTQMYEEPTPRSPSIISLHHGWVVTLLEERGTWSRVRRDGFTGWVGNIFLVETEAELAPEPSSIDSDTAAAAIALGAGLTTGLIFCGLGGCGDNEPEPIYFTNRCPTDDVDLIAVRYVDEEGNWRTRGSWRLDYGQRLMLRYRGDTLRTEYDTIYFYAETEDGDYSWEGEHNFTYDGLRLPMEARTSSRSPMQVNLYCN